MNPNLQLLFTGRCVYFNKKQYQQKLQSQENVNLHVQESVKV